MTKQPKESSNRFFPYGSIEKKYFDIKDVKETTSQVVSLKCPKCNKKYYYSHTFTTNEKEKPFLPRKNSAPIICGKCNPPTKCTGIITYKNRVIETRPALLCPGCNKKVPIISECSSRYGPVCTTCDKILKYLTNPVTGSSDNFKIEKSGEYVYGKCSRCNHETDLQGELSVDFGRLWIYFECGFCGHRDYIKISTKNQPVYLWRSNMSFPDSTPEELIEQYIKNSCSFNDISIDTFKKIAETFFTTEAKVIEIWRNLKSIYNKKERELKKKHNESNKNYEIKEKQTEKNEKPIEKKLVEYLNKIKLNIYQVFMYYDREREVIADSIGTLEPTVFSILNRLNEDKHYEEDYRKNYISYKQSEKKYFQRHQKRTHPSEKQKHIFKLSCPDCNNIIKLLFIKNTNQTKTIKFKDNILTFTCPYCKQRIETLFSLTKKGNISNIILHIMKKDSYFFNNKNILFSSGKCLLILNNILYDKYQIKQDNRQIEFQFMNDIPSDQNKTTTS